MSEEARRGARIALQVAAEAAEQGYSSGRIVERLRELGVDGMTQSHAHPHALNLANLLCEQETALRSLREFAVHVATAPKPDLCAEADAMLLSEGTLSWKDRAARMGYEARARKLVALLQSDSAGEP